MIRWLVDPRSRHREDKSDQEVPPLKKSKTGKRKSSRKMSEKKIQEKKAEKDSSSSDELPDIPF